MPTKTLFDPLPTKTAFPVDPPTTPSGPPTATSAVGMGNRVADRAIGYIHVSTDCDEHRRARAEADRAPLP